LVGLFSHDKKACKKVARGGISYEYRKGGDRGKWVNNGQRGVVQGSCT